MSRKIPGKKSVPNWDLRPDRKRPSRRQSLHGIRHRNVNFRTQIFSQEDQKDRRREIGGRAAAGGSGAVLRAEWRAEQSNLLIF
jgi:hypothetical protein